MAAAGNPQRKTLGRDLCVALLCGAMVALMGGLSYAALPFYSWLCRASGVGGTKVAAALPWQHSPRLVTVRFDSGVDRPWSSPCEDDKKPGQVIVSYRLADQAGGISVGQAGYGVGSPTRPLYFEKIHCFCFAPQTMQESRDMAVVIYVDPPRAAASAQDGVSTIRLFYGFYTVRAPVPSAQRMRLPSSGPAPPAGGI